MEVLAIVEQDAAQHRTEGLVRRAQSGELDAFEVLYREHVARTFALCLRMTGNRARAEELTQDSFVRAWERLGTLHEPGGFSAWLRRVAVNVVLSDARAKRRRPDEWAATEQPEPSALRGPRRDPAPTFDLERAIAGLPPGARHVFVLHDVEGYRHTEIAGMLRVSAGTSKAQLHRARRMLREALKS